MDASVNEGVLPVLDVERTIFAAVRKGAFDPEATSAVSELRQRVRHA
jgi:hypothetical protein